MPDPEPDPAPSAPAAPVPPAERAAAIGSRLRQIFDDAAAEPIPETFEELLRRLG